MINHFKSVYNIFYFLLKEKADVYKYCTQLLGVYTGQPENSLFLLYKLVIIINMLYAHLPHIFYLFLFYSFYSMKNTKNVTHMENLVIDHLLQ